MSQERFGVTPALRFLREKGVAHEARTYRYEEHGGTAVAAREIGVDEHCVIKTLVMEDERKAPLLVLMHGDREVSTRELARAIGAKSVAPCDPAAANKHTGYMVGGISPFGTRKALPVYVEETILDLDRICINAGKRGLMVEIAPRELRRVLGAVPVRAAR